MLRPGDRADVGDGIAARLAAEELKIALCRREIDLVGVNGRAPVEYALPAGEWSALNANVLRLQSGDGYPAGALPESLTVRPG